jgi:hypothetical protein
MMRHLLFFCALTVVGGCDYTGDWLFAGAVEDVPDIVHLGEIEPAEVSSQADIDAAMLLGEISPTGTAEKGGVTFTVKGTGDDICIWVDPELVTWNQSVSGLSPVTKWQYPDNIFDDGDLDLYAGYAVYYTGSPGETIGDFKVLFQDALGNDVPISLNECVIAALNTSNGGHSGRGAPEYCTLEATQPGVSYMILMETWSTPLDDDRLGYGLIVAHGRCQDLAGAADWGNEECVLMGETLDPETGAPRTGSIQFEQAFCDAGFDMTDYCEQEAAQKNCENSDAGCFCGDITDTPNGGGN